MHDLCRGAGVLKMNDFTKDELQELSYGLSYILEATGHDELNIALQKKLQSLIDNYCEHNWFMVEGLTRVKCKKCGELYK